MKLPIPLAVVTWWEPNDPPIVNTPSPPMVRLITVTVARRVLTKVHSMWLNAGGETRAPTVTPFSTIGLQPVPMIESR